MKFSQIFFGFTKFCLGALGVAAPLYVGYDVIENIVVNADSTNTVKTSSSGGVIQTIGPSSSGINIGALLTCLGIAVVITLVIYLIKRKK